MDGASAIGGMPAALGAQDAAGLVLLKKSQDLAALQATALLQTLPPPPPVSPGPPGVGGNVDLLA